MLEVGHGTHTGLQRPHNEDTYQADMSLGLWLVADGMGGHEHGEVASAIARDTITELVGTGHSLVDAIGAANQAITRRSSSHSGHLPMGTTVAALHLHGNNFQIAWVGDSRVYQMDPVDRQLKQLSRDHSVVRQMIDHGSISEEEARRHPRRNEITQALGITPVSVLQVTCLEGEAAPGSQFLLCSDGLTEEVADPDIAIILERADLTAQECVDQLIVSALEAGGRDNITAILVRIGRTQA